MRRSWRAAMGTALYGPGGFYTRPGAGPAGHFRTSVHASPLFAGALLRLLTAVDEALGRPDPFDLVDVGAGRGELLTALCQAAPGDLARRLRPVAVERAAQPPALPAGVSWRDELPERVTGLLVATEWLDNVPLDIVEVDAAGVTRALLVDPATGEEAYGDPVAGDDAAWLARWWPLSGSAADIAAGGNVGAPPEAQASGGARAEIGRSRDAAWGGAVAALDRGLALAVDYGHTAGQRPYGGTLAGFRDGRAVPPVPDGSCDVTASVAMDAVAAAGSAAAGGTAYTLVRQREALRALGVDGARPPLSLASADPAGYVRALGTASAAAELTDPAGLGGHLWLLQPVGVDPQSVTDWMGTP